ncbi:MAG: pyridoxal-phosphate dependent enzyme [Deltaproteobacteria bacterium]|nr:MAG: pyridoxal-phosphate dependent enzyme [Deltaproteobacteria bacterium]
MSEERPIAKLLPRLLERFEPLRLATLPTPAEQLRLPGTRSSLWIKRDDLTSPLYGGNKVRKLEFLLAEARRKGARRVLTVGAWGSNHLLATVLHSRSIGMKATGVIFPQPLTEHVERNLAADRGAGASLMKIPSKYAIPAGVVAAMARETARDGRPPYYIPGGGSSPLGILGYVNAGCELARQVEQGMLPAPKKIFVAYGTGGTAAGLVIGLRLGGLRTKVVAVRVIDRLVANRPRLLALIGAALGLARSAGDAAAFVQPASDDFEVDHRFIGRGYGHPTPEAERASSIFREAGITMECTYTAKAAAAMLDAARQERGPLLYWHTLSSADISGWVERGRND